MQKTEVDDFRTFATELANLVIAEVAASRANLGLEFKPDGTPVTNVDRAVEQALRARIESVYPEHGVLGEELPARNPDASWQWVIDPIDGTNQFAAGLPNYGSLIALCHGGVPMLGVICQPDTGEVYVGITGVGAWRNGEAIKTADQVALSESIVCISDPDAFDDATLPGKERLAQASRLNVYEGGCLSYGALAAGRIGVTLYGANLENFDICALVPVVEGAGGVITDWQGGALTIESSGAIVASANRGLHEAVLSVLNDSGRP